VRSWRSSTTATGSFDDCSFTRLSHSPLSPASLARLKPFHIIHDALIPIQRLANRPTDDQYHQPKLAAEPRDPHSPHDFLRGCITTSGTTGYYFPGERRYTPRELSLFQSFPITYKFTSPQGQATKQIGNAFPPVVAEARYRTIAKTLEAFDKGYIDAEEDISNLDEVLERKGAQRQAPPALQRAAFDPPTMSASLPSRYLVRDDRPKLTPSSS
jgi:DNA (cytosine-5)-methyltransferase 1